MRGPSSTTGRRLALDDVAEIIIGTCVLAFPVALTEEVWEISRTLPIGRVLHMFFWSVVFVGFFTYQRYFRHQLSGNVGLFLVRVGTAYFLTTLASASILLALNQLLTVEVAVAVKRVIIVSVAGSFAGTIVDSMSRGDESQNRDIVS